MSNAGGPWDEAASLADIAGGAAPPPQSGTRAVTCPNCGGTVDIRAAGYTVSVVCQYCSSVLDVANPDVAIIERNQRAMEGLALPLGSRGWVKGNEYQLVGYVRRSIDGEGWDEYLLFNPYVGYRWLTYEDGEGWSFGTMLTSLPASSGSSATYAGVRFSQDDEEWEAVVDRVVGEFYWRIQTGDRALLANYSGSGATLSRERVSDEVSWTVSEPIGRGEMSGFGKGEPGASVPSAATMAETTGRSRFAGGATETAADYDGPVEAGPFARAWRYTKIGAATAALLIVVMIVFSFGGTPAQSFTYNLEMDGREKTISFGPLAFDNALQRVVIETRADGLDNAWIDTDIALVERTSQQTITTYSLTERYSGRDSDGDWTEGSNTGAARVASVPRGSYDLVIDASAHRWPSPGYGQQLAVTTTVSSGGVFFSNFVLAFLLLMIPPIFLVWRGFKQRGGGD